MIQVNVIEIIMILKEKQFYKNVVIKREKEKFKEIQFKKECLKHEMKIMQYRNQKREIHMLDIMYLSCFNDKIHIPDDKFDTLAYGHNFSV